MSTTEKQKMNLIIQGSTSKVFNDIYDEANGDTQKATINLGMSYQILEPQDELNGKRLLNINLMPSDGTITTYIGMDEMMLNSYHYKYWFLDEVSVKMSVKFKDPKDKGKIQFFGIQDNSTLMGGDESTSLSTSGGSFGYVPTAGANVTGTTSDNIYKHETQGYDFDTNGNKVDLPESTRYDVYTLCVTRDGSQINSDDDFLASFPIPHVKELSNTVDSNFNMNGIRKWSVDKGFKGISTFTVEISASLMAFKAPFIKYQSDVKSFTLSKDFTIDWSKVE